MGKPCILIIDDDPSQRKTLVDILKLRGYETLAAKDGAEGLKARGCRVDTEVDAGKVLQHMEQDYKLLVVLDINLGAVDGVKVLKGIRERYPTKPVVMVTGYREGMSASIEKGLRIGAHACFYKPFAVEELLKVIEDVSKMKLRTLLGDL